ncbi:SAG family member [Eimeria tenella]|uniref:SAG family member n=1 Tax=Eimeria tenella TaxID=5802 RepID=U6KRJ7_EIMTE|nr:SAG family member [Eimeria tenella]CDJ40596.1 SAG family member [Eimeria tenella]|eukprot:XP_013231346.1 SAG family member [Eimeria tenella]
MLRRITALLSTSLLMLSALKPEGSQEATPPTVKYTAKLEDGVQCLDEINTPREAAGLSNFKQATQRAARMTMVIPGGKFLSLAPSTQRQDAKIQVASGVDSPFKDGTYAFKSLTDAQPSCNETVDYWKAAFKNFTILPLSKSQANGLYDKQGNVSFVALYNPSSTATADYRVVTCTKKTGTATDDHAESEAEKTPEYGYALICKTMPAALADENSAPFTQQQWDGIVFSLTGSASVAVPKLVGIFILAVGMVAL